MNILWMGSVGMYVVLVGRALWSRLGEDLDVNDEGKRARILARSFLKQLRANGYSTSQVIGVATELIDLVATDLREGDKALAPTNGAVAEMRPEA